MNVDRVATFRIRTPEGVSFSFRIASPVLRMCAWLLDACVVSAAWGVLSTAVSMLALISADYAQLFAVVIYFVLSHGYRIWTEWYWRGQSLGKKLFRLRVVDRRGFALTFPQVALRNLLRFIDVLPLMYLVGGAAALLNRRGQRLGDLAAGTLVVWEAREPAPDFELLRSGKYNSLRAHPTTVARLRQEVNPPEASAAWMAIARRDAFAPEERVRLFDDLAAQFRARVDFPEETVGGVSSEQFVRNVVEVLYLDRT